MIAEGLHAADQPVIGHARIAVFQLTHALVEQRDQVLDAVGHRRVGGEADVARVAPLAERARRSGAVLQVCRLGERDDLGKNLDLFVDAGTAAEEDVDGLLEIEQPERQAQVSRRQHLRLVAEAAGIFVVRIDQEDAQVRPRVENLLQDDGDAARLADAGGAENGEVAADQIVDVDMHRDVGVLLQVADMGAIVVGKAVDGAQVVFGHELGAVADIGIVGDAALEVLAAVLADAQFADQVEPRQLAEAGRRACGCRQRLLADFGDHPDDETFRRGQRHELADRRHFAEGRARAELNARLRAGNGDDASDRIGLRGHASVLGGCGIHD